MQSSINGDVDERRAAILTGLSSNDLRSLAREAALGHTDHNQLVFSFEELQQLCVLARNAHL